MTVFAANRKLQLAVLISGQGSNLQAIIDAILNGLNAHIQVVISDQAQAFGLQRAAAAGIPTHVVSKQPGSDRHHYDQALHHCLQNYQPDLLILAGFMRILSPEFVALYPHRILNIHPSLLPKYPGLHTHRQVLTNGDTIHGVTVHVVTAQLDGGPIIAQASLPIGSDDNEATLQAKVHDLEHRLYPYVLNLYAQGRLELHETEVRLDGKILPSSGMQL